MKIYSQSLKSHISCDKCSIKSFLLLYPFTNPTQCKRGRFLLVFFMFSRRRAFQEELGLNLISRYVFISSFLICVCVCMCVYMCMWVSVRWCVISTLKYFKATLHWPPKILWGCLISFRQSEALQRCTDKLWNIFNSYNFSKLAI